MTHYDDILMPNSISHGSSTGPSTSTQVITLASGLRKTNARWSQKLRRFPIGYNVRSPEDVYTILKLFEAVDGPANSFLIRDWNDWNTTAGKMGVEAAGLAATTNVDMPLKNTVTGGIVGDGVTKTFQMVKDYTVGGATHRRTITKPQSGTIKVAVNGVAQFEGGSPSEFEVDYATGIVTFGTAPGASTSPTAEPVTWGGAFYVPVAFVSDDFLAALATYDGSSVPNIELTEVRLA